MDTPHKRLRQARIEKSYESATKAAEAHGWNASTYRTHENGQRNYSVEDAKRYAAAFGVTWLWLIEGAIDPPKSRKLAESAQRFDARPSLYDILTKQIYDPDAMSPEEEQAVFTLQRFLRRAGK